MSWYQGVPCDGQQLTISLKFAQSEKTCIQEYKSYVLKKFFGLVKNFPSGLSFECEGMGLPFSNGGSIYKYYGNEQHIQISAKYVVCYFS